MTKANDDALKEFNILKDKYDTDTLDHLQFYLESHLIDQEFTDEEVDKDE